MIAILTVPTPLKLGKPCLKYNGPHASQADSTSEVLVTCCVDYHPGDQRYWPIAECKHEQSCYVTNQHMPQHHTCIQLGTMLQAMVESMDSAGIDVMVYPTWSNPAQLVGDYGSPDGE